MGCLGTASAVDLPLVLKFIVQQVNSKNAVEVNDQSYYCGLQQLFNISLLAR